MRSHRLLIALAVMMSLLFVTPPPGSASVPQRDTVGLFDPSSGQWHLRGADGWTASFWFGNPGDYPIVGDWDCDGVDTPGLYRQSDGYVYLRNENSQGIADIRFFFGNPGDIPLAGDFNGDGCATVSVYRPSEARIFIINSLGQGDAGLGSADVDYYFGNPGDIPFVGDFDGDGIETVGLHRPTTGFVYFRNSHTQGNADVSFFFGDPGDRFVAGDWTGNDVDTPGLFRPSDTTFYVRYTNTQGNADATVGIGAPDWIPIAGDFGLPDLDLSERTWTQQTVDRAGAVGRFNDIAIGPDGAPLISYGSAIDFAYHELRIAECADESCATAKVTPLYGAMFESTSITVDESTGAPIISFFDPSVQGLGLMTCNDRACTDISYTSLQHPDLTYGKYSEIASHNDLITVALSEGNHYTYALTRVAGDPLLPVRTVAELHEHSRPSLSLRPGGLASIVSPGEPMERPGSDELPDLVFPTHLISCSDGPCTYDSAQRTTVHEEIVPGSETVDGGYSTRSDAHTSIAVTRSGLAMIGVSWTSGPGLDLISCADPTCTARTTTRIDTTQSAGRFIDLELTADDLPIMAYTDPAGHVKVAQCLDPTCADVVTTTIATTGAGTEVSMAMDRLGMPVVAFYDKNHGDLVVARLR